MTCHPHPNFGEDPHLFEHGCVHKQLHKEMDFPAFAGSWPQPKSTLLNTIWQPDLILPDINAGSPKCSWDSTWANHSCTLLLLWKTNRYEHIAAGVPVQERRHWQWSKNSAYWKYRKIYLMVISSISVVRLECNGQICLYEKKSCTLGLLYIDISVNLLFKHPWKQISVFLKSQTALVLTELLIT